MARKPTRSPRAAKTSEGVPLQQALRGVRICFERIKGPPNYRSEAEIRSNVLKKYSPKGITASKFDPKSIMLYSFDAALFADGKGPTNENSTLSTTDMSMIKRLYPANPGR